MVDKLQIAVTAGITLACVVAAAQAGVVMSVSVTEEPGASPTEIQATFDAHRFSFDMPDGKVIFRGDEERLWVIDKEENSYQEITRKTLDELKTTMNAAMAEMREKLAQLPPEQREQMEQLMEGKFPDLDDPPVLEIRKTGESETIGAFPCDAYEVVKEGNPEVRIWSTDFKRTGLRKGDLAVLDEFTAFIGNGLPMFESMMSAVIRDFGESPGDGQVPGLPVRLVELSEDASRLVMEVASIERVEVDRAVFELPEGLSKEDTDLDPSSRY